MGHQLIYTVARFGVKGQGHCIYSYDKHFPQDKLRDTSYFSKFKLPNTINVSDITDASKEEVSLPYSFAYFFDGKYNFFSKRYLGKEYLISNARPGNFLNHWVILDELRQYPIEKFESPTFRTSMDVEEVDNTKIPDYLSDNIELLNGSLQLDIVREFIKLENNKEILSRLLSAVLDEQINNQNKTVIIIDEFENIPLWIAAILYSLPLTLAKQLSFSTFEYSPNESFIRNKRFDIVGVIPEGTDFRPNNSMFFHVFDMQKEVFPTTSRANYRYSDWAVATLLDNTNGLASFEKLLIENFNYLSMNKDIDTILSYYEYLNNKPNLATFKDSMSAISVYGKPHTQFKFFEQLLVSPILSDVLTTNYRKDIVSHIRNKNKESKISLFNDYLLLLKSSERDEQYDSYLMKELCDDFVLFSQQLKLKILNNVNDIELFQNLFKSYLISNINEALLSVKYLDVTRQKKIETILMQFDEYNLIFVEQAINDQWDSSLTNKLIHAYVDQLCEINNDSLITLIINWYSTHVHFELPTQLYLSYVKKALLLAKSQKERLSILRKTIQKLQSETLPHEILDKFCTDILDFLIKDVKSPADIESYYKIISTICNVDSHLVTCLLDQINRGHNELFFVYLQFFHKNKDFSEEQTLAFVSNKKLKRNFEEIDRKIKQDKIQVSNKFYRYFVSLKNINSEANKFKLFSIFGR